MTHRIAFTDAEASSLRQILPTLPGQDAIALDGADGRLALRVVDDAGKPLAIPLASAVYEGGGCRLLLDRRHLLDALDAGFRNFLFADTVSPVVSRDGIGGMHVLMPMRDTGKPPVAESEPSHASHASHASAASAPAPATTTRWSRPSRPDGRRWLVSTRATRPTACGSGRATLTRRANSPGRRCVRWGRWGCWGWPWASGWGC